MTKSTIQLVLVLILSISIGNSEGYAQISPKQETNAHRFFSTYIDSVTSNILQSEAISEQLLAKNYGKHIRNFYNRNNFQALWLGKNLEFALSILDSSVYHGLNPDDYHAASLNEFKAHESIDYRAKAAFDIKLTQCLYAYANDLVHGKLNPSDFHLSWNFSSLNKLNIDSVFISLFESNRLLDFDAVFAPVNQQYLMLKKELQALYQNDLDNSISRDIVFPGILLRVGDSNVYVKRLKYKLYEKAYLKQADINMSFDHDMEIAIKYLQQKHGLKPDGVAGKNTYRVLNWSEQKYIDCLKVNLERLRWMGEKPSEPYVQVNIPEFRLRFYNKDSVIYNTKVIVGKYKHQTPVFQSKLNYVVFNPCWTVPNSIAVKSILPRLKTDTSYLDNRNMFVCVNGIKQNHAQIDFTQYSASNFPYKIFQNTDPRNALGKVKFMFENKYSIYLHDTPSKSLFRKDYRALSHGCIRVQNAMQLADVLLYKIDKHSKTINHYLSKGYPEKAYLKDKVPLYIEYFTCRYSNKLKQVQFFNDIYAFDYKIIEALEE